MSLSFAIACRDLRSLQDRDKFGTWLGGICRNVTKQMLRVKTRTAPLPGRDADGDAGYCVSADEPEQEEQWDIVPDPYDSGVDFSMDHYSSTQSRVDKYKGGEISRTIYGNCNTKTAILVDHYHKSYVRMTLERIMPDRFRMDPNSMVQRFLSCQHKELGQKVIDGVLCEGIETTDPAFYDGDHPPETLRSTGSTSIRC